MKGKIKKIETIDNENFVFLESFFNDYEYNSSIFPHQDNVLIYSYIDTDVVRPQQSLDIFSLKNTELSIKFTKCIEYIKSNYNLKNLWLMTYPPKSKLSFHIDAKKNRHIITINSNPRFFSYSTINGDLNVKGENYNAWLKHMEIDTFNEKYLNDDDQNYIEILESKTIYVFKDTLHTIINDSDKLRINFVFEILD
jgi:hypothetical protein